MKKEKTVMVMCGLLGLLSGVMISSGVSRVFGPDVENENRITSIACETDAAYEETCADGEISIECEAISETDAASPVAVDKEAEAEIREYKQKGILYDDRTGSWLWKKKPVAMLLDESGSFYKNGSEQAEKNKIYLLVKRKSDNSIDFVKQITSEEVLSEFILRENKK